MGLGIIKVQGDTELFFLYAPGVSMSPRKTIDIIKSEGISGWDYAIDSNTIGLTSGETKLLGVYRQDMESLRTYDLQKEDSIDQMIKENITVLLLKIKVEEKQ